MYKRIFEKTKYELCLFIWFMICFAVRLPVIFETNTLDWTMSYYVLSYELGFSTRFFMGSVLRLFSDYFTSQFFMVFWSVSTVLLSAFTARFIGRSIASLDGEARTAAYLFAGLFIASPGSIQYLFCFQNFGRLDLYLIPLVLASIFCMTRRYLRWLVPALSLICMLIHQAFLFMFMPIVSILLLYNVYASRRSRSSIALCAVSYTVMIASFCYLQFFSSVPFENETQMAAAMAPHAGFTIIEPMLWLEYFLPVPQHFNELCRDLIPFHLRGLALFAAFSIPLIAAMVMTWRRALKSVGDPLLKFIYFLCLIAPVALLPNFVLTIDWDRWLACVVITQFFLLFALLRRRADGLLEASTKFLADVKRRPSLWACGFIIMAAFSFLSSDHNSSAVDFFSDTVGLFVN